MKVNIVSQISVIIIVLQWLVFGSKDPSSNIFKMLKLIMSYFGSLLIIMDFFFFLIHFQLPIANNSKLWKLWA